MSLLHWEFGRKEVLATVEVEVLCGVFCTQPATRAASGSLGMLF
jgi:hypothetical protein